ncbi:MAG: alpha/beta fold hydrolase [Chloroflexi bacterium]|nr:alpha/beta fold hydrolase [Chloroflexota bacterium]
MLDVVLRRNGPPVGATPRDPILHKGTMTLYRYRPFSDEVYRVPVVLVMSLISKPYILDLTPGQSFVEYLLRNGFDVFMIDWGVPRPEDSKLKLEDYVLDRLPLCLERVQEITGETDFTILGYCMGGLFGLFYGGIFPQAPMKNLVCIATPVDYEGMPQFRTWMDQRYFDVDYIVDTMGNVPPDLVLLSFEMLRPAERWTSYVRLWDNLWNDAFVHNYRVMYRWIHDQIPLPGEAYRQTVKELLWGNKLMKGEMTIDGKRVDTRRITCPVFHGMAQHDHIAPYDAAKPLITLVGSTETEDMVLKGGHVSLVAGPNALVRLWPRVVEWLSERSV